MNFTRGNPIPGVGLVAVAHRAARRVRALSPAVRLAVALSVAVHAMGVASLMLGNAPRGQLSDAPAASTAQTVLSLDTPPAPSPEPAPPTAPSEPTPAPDTTPPPAPTPAPPAEQPAPAAPTSLFSTESGPTAPPSPPTRLTPPPAPTTADAAPRSISFAGMDAKRAERIVYVVDASGPMVSHWGWATAQLRLSLSRLDTTQKFQVLISRLLPAPADAPPDSMRSSEVLDSTGGANALTPATQASIADAVTWLSRQRLRGASDPLPGLSRALELKPDLILLLSHSFDPGLLANVGRTTEAILAELDRLNPADAQGHRAVVIKTIQLGNEDPTGLMQAIAKQHGDGPGSYHVVTPGELEKTDGSK